jgi:hypothetical protein
MDHFESLVKPADPFLEKMYLINKIDIVRFIEVNIFGVERPPTLKIECKTEFQLKVSEDRVVIFPPIQVHGP